MQYSSVSTPAQGCGGRDGLLGAVGLTHSTPRLLLWAALVPSSGDLCDIGMLGTWAGDGQNVLMALIWAGSCYFGGCDLMLRRCLWKHGRVTVGVVQSSPQQCWLCTAPWLWGVSGAGGARHVCAEMAARGAAWGFYVSSGPKAGFSHEVFWPE